MIPLRGLSMSAMRKNEIDTIRVITRNTMNSAPLRRMQKPIRRLQQRAMLSIRDHAEGGIRFHHAACVYPCEFNTSFIPETASAVRGDGCKLADLSTVVHNSACSWAVSAFTRLSSSSWRIL